ncbi:EAL domain-containing protein [Sphaerotilus sp.]|uniref:EAL domain-containing protein n=1 Tax=Sphaerotilus sp. TaxID=2093942 RepID=UPI002ACE96CB|nr:EAL domain-containing protein [Sphaerotilus sp.]MDZ7856744.1 EAL domain-containing protein [Sphaerotilus sp.]
MTVPAPLAPDEAQRLSRLRALAILDSAAEPIFDTLTALASQVCCTPIALVSLVDGERQWFKSNVGMPGVTQTPRDLAFCAHTILGEVVMEVADAALDPRFTANPLVTDDPGIRFYAGAPLTLSDGHRVGTLCVIDRRPRQLDPGQRAVLTRLAEATVQALEMRERGVRALDQLNAERDYLAHVLEGANAGAWEWDITTGHVQVDERWAAITGRTVDEVRPRTVQIWCDLCHPDDLAEVIRRRTLHLQRQIDFFECEARMRHKDGRWVWVLDRATVTHWSADGRPLKMSGAHIDISARKATEQALHDSREMLRVTLQSIADAVITTDAHGAVTWLNPVAERMTGWTRHEARGCAIEQVFHIVHGQTREPAPNPVRTSLAEQRTTSLAEDTVLIGRDGIERDIEDSAAPIRDAEGALHGVVLVFHDVTEQRRLSQEMHHRARHDALTGLVNRGEFDQRLNRALARAQHDQSDNALLYLDLDQFKLVNDACGHATGDLLLRQIGGLLRDAVRTRDTLARLGGDEFGVLLEHCSTDQARRVAQQICDRMDEFRFVHDERRFRVGVSIGLVPVDRRWSRSAMVMQAADAACYAAKEAGRNRVHTWYDSDEALRERHGQMQWTTRLEQALDEHRFELHAQRIEPIRRPGEKDAVAVAGLHCEVLLRLREADGTLVLPGAFLPAAERFQMASRLDRWVVREVFDTLSRAAVMPQVIAINLSGQSLGDRSFHQYIRERVAQAPFDVTRLCFEVTETTAITHLGEATVFMREMRALGIRIALDDFGAGTSSFGYLKSLPVDVLKIDGQFIRDLTADALDLAAVRCFHEVAQVVGVQTVAEFVESEAVLARIGEIGIDFAQGYLIHRPEPLARVLASGPADPAQRSSGRDATRRSISAFIRS